MEIKDDWKPTAENINSLPKGLREYVCHIETLCDPGGLVQENAHLREDRDALVIALEEERKGRKDDQERIRS